MEPTRFEGTHTRWNQTEGFADNLAKFSATIQGQAYSDCLRRYSKRHQFVGFIDVDEFVVLLDSSIKKIDDMLRRYQAFGGVSLYWRIFGSSGQKEKTTKWVTSTYLKCLPRTSKQNTQFKVSPPVAIQIHSDSRHIITTSPLSTLCSAPPCTPLIEPCLLMPHHPMQQTRRRPSSSMRCRGP